MKSKITLFVIFSLAWVPFYSSIASFPSPRSAPWTVFTPATSSLPMGPNLLANPGFESGSSGHADNWNPYSLGYSIDAIGGVAGSRAVILENPVSSESHGAYQTILLNQTERKPLYFSANSRSDSISGSANNDYSFYLDIYYIDDTPLYGQTLTFATGTHDWQFQEGFIIPAKPIRSISAYCLLRNSHSGTAWFDDLSIKEVEYDIVNFDANTVAAMAPSTPPFGGPNLLLHTDDGLEMLFASDGGAVTGISLNGNSVHRSDYAFTSGFFVRDVSAGSDFVSFGGELTQAGNAIMQTGSISELELAMSSVITSMPDRLSVHAEITNTSTADRALTVYFALPVLSEGWSWGDHIRSSRTITGSAEFANFRWTALIGANGKLSKYPFASISGQSGGIAMAIPLASPRICRLIQNPSTGQFYIAFDVGLTSLTTQFPNRADLDFIIYKTNIGEGFRGAVQGYADRFPDDFVCRIPPEQQGVWVAFSDLSPIPNIEDFGIRFHELGSLSQIAFDDAHGIFSFRYVSEPWSHWLPIDDPSVDPNDYDQVIAYLIEKLENGTPSERQRAEATLSSGFFDDANRYIYASDVEPWCSGVSGCAVFTLNPDPDVQDGDYPLNKANHDWNQTVRNVYQTYPGLDGEYIDSYLARTLDLDFRSAHLAASDYPSTFRTTDRRLGIPEVFCTTEFARWLTHDVHDNLNRWTMANGILIDMPWGADLFDFMGIETDWLASGSFTPPPDASLNYYRTLSGQKPYGFLMNTNFDNLTYDLVERYFQICAFYGIYPSMFSHNASENRYWDDPALYDRDRPLFVQYIPLIRELNTFGWEAITHATASSPAIYLERFGDWPNLYFTIRNMTSLSVEATVRLDSAALGLPEHDLTGRNRIVEGIGSAAYAGGWHEITFTLAGDAVEILQIVPLVVPTESWIGLIGLTGFLSIILLFSRK